MTLTEFLLARIAWDEAERTHVSPWLLLSDFVARDDAARWRAECEAKRRIVDYFTEAVTEGQDTSQAEDALCAIAAVYSDHPDYREEWKP